LGTKFAMLRWMKTSPASRPMTSFTGTRLSEFRYSFEAVSVLLEIIFYECQFGFLGYEKDSQVVGMVTRRKLLEELRVISKSSLDPFPVASEDGIMVLLEDSLEATSA
jgi:hypothetical protein